MLGNGLISEPTLSGGDSGQLGEAWDVGVTGAVERGASEESSCSFSCKDGEADVACERCGSSGTVDESIGSNGRELRMEGDACSQGPFSWCLSQ